MRRLGVCLLGIAASLAWVSIAAASQGTGNQSPGTPPPTGPPEPQFPRISVGALTYFQYAAELKNRNGFNAFDVTRGYVNIAGDLAKKLKFRLTPDLKRVTDGSLSGSLVFRLKYGFVEFHDLTPRSWLRFGLHQTPWLDFEESVNRYRVQGTMFAEREDIIAGSSDFGVGYLTRLPSNYGEINVGVYNGEGFTQSEVDKRKSIQARVTIRPLPHRDLAGTRAHGLRVSAFFDAGSSANDRPRRHGLAMVSYEHPHFVGTAQWLAGTVHPAPLNAEAAVRGYSVFAEAREGTQGWAGFARFEGFNPNRHLAGISHRRFIAGGAYWLAWSAVRIGLVLSDEDVRYERGASQPNENRLLFQTQIQF
jgi:hypothetical protein